MPSIVTHYLFSEDVRIQTTKEIQTKLKNSINIYHIFAQSFDNLFYYNLLSLKKGKDIRKFGNTAQKIKIDSYFKNILQIIKSEKLEKNEEVIAYLFGSLTHYILDSNCHPFIIHQAGWIHDKETTKKYRGNHEKIEVSIDAIYYEEKRHNKLYKTSLANTLLPKTKFSKELINVLNKTFEQTFQQKNIGKIFEKSTMDGHFILKYFVTDHTGIKKQAYKLFDFIFQQNPTKYQYLSFYIPKPTKKYLNREHLTWLNPTTKEKHTESFDDLYNKALKEALTIFEEANKVLNNQTDIETFIKLLGKKSYTTGLDWTKQTKFKYFKNQNP